MADIIKALNWRYAAKKFDTARKVSDDDLNELLEAARLAPSSYGLQPWKLIVITDPELRKKLREHAWNQPQVTDASHLIILAARADVDENYVKRYVEDIAKQRKTSVEALKGYQDMMTGDVNSRSKEQILEWSKHQVYIALGFMLETAALKGIDACPMEGFDPAKFDKILELKKSNLASTVLCAIGYRAADDPAAKSAKVRFNREDIVIHK
jgi:nitroreductase/dihydropteridine reductase